MTYRAHVAKMFELAGRALPPATVDAVIAFETSFAKLMLDNVARRDPKASDHVMSATALAKLAPGFAWVDYAKITPEQQFFLAWGQWRGDATRPETQRLMVQGDPHPVAKWRVNGPLSNLPQFAAAFSCKPGAAMVRDDAKRCAVW